MSRPGGDVRLSCSAYKVLRRAQTRPITRCSAPAIQPAAHLSNCKYFNLKRYVVLLVVRHVGCRRAVCRSWLCVAAGCGFGFLGKKRRHIRLKCKQIILFCKLSSMPPWTCGASSKHRPNTSQWDSHYQAKPRNAICNCLRTCRPAQSTPPD